MTRPAKRPQSAAEKRLAASLSGAVDLSGLKTRVEARQEAEKRATGPSAGAGAAVTAVDVDEQGFEQQVLVQSTKVPVVVELGSRRAPTAMTAVLTELAEAAGGAWVHARVDVDVAPGVAEAFQVRAVPTVVAVAAGRPLADFEGEQPRESLEQWIGAILKATEGKLAGPDTPAGAEEDPAEATDPERDAAEEALATGDLGAAEERFSALVESRGGDHTLLEALRHVQAARRVAEGADSGEGTGPAALRAADRALQEGAYEQAYAVLVDAIRVTAGDERTALRTRLLELLDALPADDDRVLAARRALASALY